MSLAFMLQTAAPVLWAYSLVMTWINRLMAVNLSKWDPPEEVSSRPMVSIVVPARNEERDIERAVTSMCLQDYPDVEVIVVDDQSTDDTPEILERLAERFDRLRVIRGSDPPPGWLGKPNALQQGLAEARGTWVVFSDADVVYAPSLVRRAVAFVEWRGAEMLFLGPTFETKTVMEACLLSTLYLVSMGLVPLFLVERVRSPKLAVGGGVFNMVRRDVLREIDAFRCLKDAVVDDVRLGVMVKAGGFRQTGALAGDLIRIRMYRGARETVEGFTKNVYPMIRRFPWVLLVPLIMGTVMSLLPYLWFGLALAGRAPMFFAAAALILMHMTMLSLVLIFRQPWQIIFLNPVRELGWWWIILRSFARYRKQGLVWRGRRYGDVSGEKDET